MTRNDVLERLAALSGAPTHDFEDLVRLRAKRQRVQKISALALVTVLLVALVSVGLVIADRSVKPANPPEGLYSGMVIRYTGDPISDSPRQGDLVAVDPTTGETITLADASGFSHGTISLAAASADGRWVAFDNAFCKGERNELWVTNGTDQPRLLLPCADRPAGPTTNGWAWSPTGSQLAVVQGEHLVLIDPATGDRTDLGQVSDDAGSPTWSPDGSQIAYETHPGPNGNSTHGSVYVVNVNRGDETLIAESLGQIPAGEEGTGIAWSPDGTHLAVLGRHAGAPPWNATLYVMNADGSERSRLAERVLTQHVLGSTNIAWSPDGTRIAYATVPDDAYDKVPDTADWFRIWNAAPDGTAPVLVFDAAVQDKGLIGGPVWSPDGASIAFRYDRSFGEHRWLVASATGTGGVNEIDELKPLSWRGGWYFCECYG